MCCLFVWLALAAVLCAADEPVSGWRGNSTGLWPGSHPPTQWLRIPHGAMEGLRASVDRPPGPGAGDTPRVEKGQVRDWLVIGPFAVDDSIADFDRDVLGGEASIEPSADDKSADHTWQRASAPPDDPMVFGEASLPWLDLVKSVGFARNQLAYAHTYLYSPRGGPARIVAEHTFGLKAWVNGKVVYRSPRRQDGVGSYAAISRHELQHRVQPAGRFDVQLKPGWNRLLLKLSTSNRQDWTLMNVCLRINDPPDVPYESKNIAWMTELPARSTSTPIIVGQRIFLMAEPDELVCLDKLSGRILWTATANLYDALTPAQRQANPAYAQRVDPLIAQLKAEPDRARRVALRAAIHKALLEIDEPRFTMHLDGHFESHFGIVGFTMPTPVSDGRYVYVWCGMGVAACYDLDGRRRWITRLDTGPVTYGSSPSLADGVLAVYQNRLYGLDARTGELRWTQQRIVRNQAAVLATRLDGHAVFVTQRGEVVRPSDGELLFRPRGGTLNDEGWSPPIILGDTMYLPKYGVTTINVFDFRGSAAEPTWEPKLAYSLHLPDEVSHKPDGGWIDRWTAGSPLVFGGIVYQSDIYQSLYAVDIKTRRMLYRHDMALRGFTHYNSVAVAASATLVGGHVLVVDNQGTTLVLEPGPTYKVVARNRIDTQLERWWPIPAQETLAYAPPIADGDRLYLRGERYLYCIAAPPGQARP